MSIIREKIRFNGRDMNLKFSLGNVNGRTGLQQNIDEFTQITTNTSINDAEDFEVRRFSSKNSLTFVPDFWNGTEYFPSYIYAGFTESELKENSPDFLNSYFILDFYDDFNPNTGVKIFSTYYTKLSYSNAIVVPINSDNQFYKWEIPLNFLNSYSGTTITGYTRFSFFNAKTGNIQLFFNTVNSEMTTQEIMFFKTILNKTDMTWTINGQLVMKELITSQNYIDRYNNTFEKFDNLKQNYPSGNVFNFNTGKYEIIE